MKYLVNSALVVATLIVVLLVQQYFFCPQFQFIRSSPFRGSKFYNPYAEIKPGNWIKCNFHAHTNAWNSVTNGQGNAADVWRVYESMGYKVHCVSNYQKIDKSFAQQQNYMPAYEHGYNIKKTHQLVIGDDEVTWLDYIFPQTICNKQWVLNKLAASGNGVVVLNHPIVRNGYTSGDMADLKNFNCIEVLNPGAISFEVWDAVLSQGKAIFIIGDDDVHNIFNPFNTGKFCTWLNVGQVSRASVVDGLKKGRGYGMRVGLVEGENATQRIERIKNHLPVLQQLQLNANTIEVQFTDTARALSFIGQHGKILDTAANVTNAFYTIKDKDEYVRIAARFKDGTEIYLNPVFRYAGEPFANKGGFIIDKTRSAIFYSVGIIILFTWGLFFLRVVTGINFSKKKKTYSQRPTALSGVKDH